MNVNRATFQSKFAYLSGNFGKELAMKKLNCSEEELEKIVGQYVKGKRKGLLKGKIVWRKCIKGGWVKTGPYDFDAERATGYVAVPNRCDEFAIVDSWTGDVIKRIHNETTTSKSDKSN